MRQSFWLRGRECYGTAAGWRSAAGGRIPAPRPAGGWRDGAGLPWRIPGGRKVAVKLLLPQHGADEEFRRRFAREIEAARQVGGFHTASVVDADPYSDPPWMVTAYIPGPSLDTFTRENGPMAPGAVADLGAGLAEGLAAVHACGLVHRDLKPSNIVMADDGPRIIDFGIARPAGASVLTAPGSFLGTFAFMSPEQVRGEEVGPEGDVFSLGAVLAYAATGHGPFDAPTIPAIVYRVLTEPPDLSGVPGPIHDVIGACLAKDPASRPGVTTLLGALSSLPRQRADARPASALLPPQPPQPVAPTQAAAPVASATAPLAPPRTRRRRRWLTLAGLALAAATAAAIAIPLGLHHAQPAAKPDPAAARRIAKGMMASYGWNTTTDFSCLDSLWNYASGWVYNRQQSDGSYGIPAALPPGKMATAGSDWRTNPGTQIRWGLGYIKSNYQAPCRAWQHLQTSGYY